MGVIGEVADLVNGDQAGAQIGAEPPLQGTGGVLAGQVENQISRGDQARRVAGEDRLMHEILGEQRLAQPVRGDYDPGSCPPNGPESRPTTGGWMVEDADSRPRGSRGATLV